LLQELLYCLMWIAVQHRIDFRFIPAEMTFSTPSSSYLTNSDPDKYQLKTFFTTALHQGKVELTWDEENQERANAIKDTYKMGDWEELDNLDDLKMKKMVTMRKMRKKVARIKMLLITTELSWQWLVM